MDNILTSKYVKTIKNNKHISHGHTQSIKQTRNKLYIGCHFSIVPSILDGLQHLTRIKGNAGQIFLGSTKTSSLKSKHNFTDKHYINNIKSFIMQHNIFLSIHSIYLLNFCKASPSSNMIKYMHDNIQYDLKYGALIGARCVVLHLGYKLLLDPSDAIKNFINNINHIIKHMPDNISLALETSAGQGSQIGYTLEELSIIWDGVKHNNNTLASRRVGICIDTAHIFTGGYDIKTENGIKLYLDDFNKLIGWKNIILFHINDSKYDVNTKKDFHTGIGNGFIFNTKQGISALKYIKTFSIKHNIPMILETHKTMPNNTNATDDTNTTKETDTTNTHNNTGFSWEIQYIKKL